MSYLKNSDYSNPSLDGRPQHSSIIKWVDQAYKALRNSSKVCLFHSDCKVEQKRKRRLTMLEFISILPSFI